MNISLSWSTKKGVAIVALSAMLFAGVSTALAANEFVTGLAIKSSPSSNLEIDEKGNFVFQAQDIEGNATSTDATLSVSLSDGGNGGSFFDGTVGGECNSDSALTDIPIANGTTQKAFCYSNSTPGTYTIELTGTTGAGLVEDSVSVTVAEPTAPLPTNVASVGDTEYETLQDAIDHASGGIVTLLSDVQLSQEIIITQSLTLDGDGHIISPNFTKSGPQGTNNAAIGIISATNVVIKNLTIEGTGGTSLHGINVYESTGVELEKIISKNNDYSGIVVGSSAVTIVDVTTSGNGWHGINVDQNTTSPSSLTINGISHQDEVAQIFVDDVSRNVSVDDINEQYDSVDAPNPKLEGKMMRIYTLKGPRDTESVTVTDDTAIGENQPGWLFNRDQDNVTPFVFDIEKSSLGIGALHILPIGSNAADKFIAEYFANTTMGDTDTFSYDFSIANGGDTTDAGQFYLNVYANFASSDPNNYYDCKYDVVPTTGTVGGWTTVTFDPDHTYPVTQRGATSCPTKPADMGTDAVIRAFAINAGDTSVSDEGLEGYIDNVVFETGTTITTFDFEPKPIDSVTPSTRPTFSGELIYDAIPAVLPSNLPSQPFQAQATAEFGDKITFAANTNRTLEEGAITLSSWACESGSWDHLGTCETTPGATFQHPITLNLYAVAEDGSRGDLIATKTQTFEIPFRPSANVTCADPRQWKDTNGNCFNGYNYVVVFNLAGIVVPDSVIFGVAYNTQTYGAAPLGVDGPYSSLNVSLNTDTSAPYIGTDVDTDEVYWDSRYEGRVPGFTPDSDGRSLYRVAVAFTAHLSAGDDEHDDLTLDSDTQGEVTVEDNTIVLSNTSNLDLSNGIVTSGVENSVILNSGPAPTIVITNSDDSTAQVTIQNGTTITTDAGWNGTFIAPQQVSATGITPAGFQIGDTVIEVGAPGHKLTLDAPATIFLPGVRGPVGYKAGDSDTWVRIEASCSGTFEAPVLPDGEQQCHKADSTGTKILTLSFSSFAALTVEGSSGGSSSGGTRGTRVRAAADTTTEPAGRVLGASTVAVAHVFASEMGNGASGDEVSALQAFLIARGYLQIAAPTGYFGPMTEAALKLYQGSKGISATGYFGPLTLAAVNGEQQTSADVQIATLRAQLDVLVKELQTLLDAQK